jgi:hypothetical protein
MERSDFRLRSILLAIDEKLTNNERQRLCFLIGPEDVPRRLLDVIAKDGSVSMKDIWETLFDRRKLTVNNVNYLIVRLEEIERFDLVELLKDYCPVPFSLSATPLIEARSQVERRTTNSDLFSRIDP